MKNVLSFCLLLISFASFAQYHSFEISGKVIDEKTKKSVEEVTVYLEKVKDSSVVTYSITDYNGTFELEGKTTAKNLYLYFSHVGYQTVRKKIDVRKKKITFPKILLKDITNTLGEVVITSTPPVSIKKDTLEFNVKSFKTQKNANVEDLLKKLPGVEVDKNGKIMVNGKPVTKIMVNGKEFFANDPTIATRNLTKEMIEKVQVTDTKNKSEAFTGEQGDKESKTINLTIKKENNKGVFGRVSAGVGTNKLYEAAGILNYFNNNQRLSVLAGGNNVNSPGFSFGEIQKMFGGRGNISVSSSMDGITSFSIGGRSFGGGEGLVTSKNAGANYADELAKGIDFSADYFYSSANSNNAISSYREYALPDRQYTTNRKSTSSHENDNHSFNARTEIKIDSTLFIEINPSFRYSKGISERNSNTSSSQNNGTLINKSKSNHFSNSDNKDFKSDIRITKRTNQKGGFYRFIASSKITDNRGDTYQKNEVEVTSNPAKSSYRNQKQENNYNSKNIGIGVIYNIALKAKSKRDGWFLRLSQRYDYNLKNDKKSTFDFDNTSQLFKNFNTDQSTDFSQNSKEHNTSASLQYRSKKGNIRLRTNYIHQTLESNDYLRPELNLKRRFNFINFSSGFWYKLTQKTSVRLSYRLNNNAPNLSYLQAFKDISNPLHIVTGNPNLQPQKRHRISGGINSFNFQKREGIYIYYGAAYTENKAISKSYIDNDLIRNTTYTNVSGDYNYYVGGGADKSVKIDSLHTAKFRLGISLGRSKYQNYSNDVLYSSKNNSISPSFGITFSGKNWEINPKYRISHNVSKFDIPSFSNHKYIGHHADMTSKITFFKKLEWNNSISYKYNPTNIVNFEKAFWIWNATLSYSFAKDKASLALKAYDILNQNNNFSKRLTQDYIEEKTNLTLQQYVMLSFSWKFNNLGKKGETNTRNFYMF